VGGTDFNDLTTAATYWNSANNSTTQASAKSYIPETTWNDTCTNPVFGTLLGFSTNAETNCNNSQLVSFVSTIGSSGGKSSCISSDGQTPNSCAGGYAKPSWQSALTPNDGERDVPDVSLFSAAGSPSGSFYVICEADLVSGYTSCNPSDSSTAFLGIGGTSASAPAFAGIMALVNQQTGSRQGNANYVLYRLAAQQPTAFHDTTTGTIAMPCQNGSPDCNTATSGHQYGVLTGYNAVAGYDLATGLGSVNAFNLVTKWNSVTLLPSVTTLSSLTPTTITHGQPVSVSVAVAPQSGTGTPAGTIALVGGPTGSVMDFDNHVLSNGSATWTTSLLPGGTYNVSAHYPGDGNYSASDSATSVPVVVNKEDGNVAVGLMTFDGSGRLISSNATTATYGSPYILRMGVTGTTCSSNSRGQAGCPTGDVSLTDNGNPLDAGTYTLNELGYAEDWVIQLTGGSHAVQASYAGDNSFNPGTANAAINITPASTTIGIPFVFNAVVGNPVQVNTTIHSSGSGEAPTGTVTFSADGTPINGTVTYTSTPGSLSGVPTLNASLISSSSPFPSTGSYTVTAAYSGDSNYAPVSSAGATVQVKHPVPLVNLQASSNNLPAGSNLTLTATVVSASTTVAPTGTISFNSTTSGSIAGNVTYDTVTDANGYMDLQATITFVATASDTLSVSYSGDTNYPEATSPPFAITVTGNDFSLSFSGSATMTVTQGHSGQLYDFVVAMQSDTAPVTFSANPCSGLPAETTCGVVSPVTYTSTTLVYVSTTAPHATARPAPGSATLLWWQTGLVVGLVGIFFIGGSAGKWRWTASLLVILIACLLTLPSCGGGSSAASGGGGGGGGTIDPGTPKGTYTITVTGTSGTITHTASFQLVVQ
jgi:hypothetical protein